MAIQIDINSVVWLNIPVASLPKPAPDLITVSGQDYRLDEVEDEWAFYELVDNADGDGEDHTATVGV